MKKKAQILDELARSRFISRYAARLMGEADNVYRDDIIAELYLYVCELPAEKVECIYKKGGAGAVRNYVAGMIYNQLNSKKSDIYLKYTRHVYRQRPVDEIWDSATPWE